MINAPPRPPLGPEEESKARRVRAMFQAIAPRYDLLNHLLSLNVDRRWRKRAVRRLLNGRAGAGRYLDACAGTLDLATELVRQPGFQGWVVGCDFVFSMLRRGVTKTAGLPIAAACADALCLPFPDACLDGAMVAFGVRNLAALDLGLQELQRVLKPGAPLVILEFAVPDRQPLRALYLFYFRRLLPWIGRLVSRHRSAYAYLPASVLEFPPPAELAGRLQAAGFTQVAWETYTGGIVATHRGSRGAHPA